MNLAAGGTEISPRARRMAITIEPAVVCGLGDEHHLAHLMLEDIERAFALDTRIAPFSVRTLQLDSWAIVPPPNGLDAVVLQILGSAEYQRPSTQPRQFAG
jgi:hypothetical protein